MGDYRRAAFKSIPNNLFKPTKVMAANQGLYNGFLAAGLFWAIFISDAYWSKNVAIFFLTCVIVAGIYGAYSVSRRIFIFPICSGYSRIDCCAY
jgi:putative membrane protein